jgi:hypothetical protein
MGFLQGGFDPGEHAEARTIEAERILIAAVEEIIDASEKGEIP